MCSSVLLAFDYNTFKMADVVELQKLKLAELKQECAVRDLDVKGNKSDLIGRLQTYLEEHDEMNEEEVLGEFAEVSFTKDATSPIHKEDQEPIPEKAEEKKVVKISPPATVDERLHKRAERFNLPASADSKKEARAARFGIPSTTSSSTQGASATSKPLVNVEALKKRAERFGMNVSSVSKKVEEDEKLKKRKERFGILTSATSAGAEDSEAKKRKRAERFGNV